MKSSETSGDFVTSGSLVALFVFDITPPEIQVSKIMSFCHQRIYSSSSCSRDMAIRSKNPEIVNSMISKALRNMVVLTPAHLQYQSSLPRYRHPDFWSRGEESTVLGADVYGPIVAPFLIDQRSPRTANN